MNDDIIKDFIKKSSDLGFEIALIKMHDDNFAIWGGDWGESPFIEGSLSKLANAFAGLSAMFREAAAADLYEMSEHMSDSGVWLGPDEPEGA
jgi:hypothetical protein